MNAQVHHMYRRSGKEDKQVNQNDYVTSSQSDEGLHHHNTCKMFNIAHTTVYYTPGVCYHVQSVWEKWIKRREGSYLCGRHVTNFFTKSCLFDYEWQCKTMYTCTILIVNLHPE